jgi:hypothetical protein
MKTTRSFNLVKVLLLAALAVGLNARLASAQELEGKFTLPFAASWGGVVLQPGGYTFQFDMTSTSRIAVIRHGRQCVGMVMPTGWDEQGNVSGSSALIAVRSGGKYRITLLRLAQARVVFRYRLPKAERQIVAQAPQLIRRVPVLMAAR